MISGIKRKTTAIEGTQRFFQTVDLIISHFKREADKQKIYELKKNKPSTLNDLLIATAAIHIYHNLGIRIQDSLELRDISVDSTKKLELREKKIFFDEIKKLLKDSLKLEIDMMLKKIDLDNKILSLLVEERKKKLQNFERQNKIKSIENQIEQNLMEIILNYPAFYFYDLIGDLIGLTNKIKIEILEESSAFKDLSVDIEKKLISEEKEDKFIELATLNRLINEIQNKFEFKSYKELQTQAMPVRMLKRKIIEYKFEYFPISVPGMTAFQEANNLKKELIIKIKEALNRTIEYDLFEEEIFIFLKSKIIKYLKTNPNDFIYFLECLNEASFTEIIFTLNKYGVFNILEIINVDDDIVAKVKKNMIRYNIDKFDIMALGDKKKNLLFIVRKVICNLGFPFLDKVIKQCDELSDFDLIKILYLKDENLNELWKILEKESGYPIGKIREFIRKKNVIDKVFLQDLNLRNYSQIITILAFEDILNNLVKDIFYYVFSKILRQLSRIIELYLKITNDKALFLVALKKMYGTTESEQWIWVKLEELLIERIIKRQNELVIVFNAKNQPFLVNGFLLARMVNKSLKDGIWELKNEPSPIYEDVKPIKLRTDIISPISYCLAFDLIKRFESFEELRKLQVEQIIESKEKEKEEKRKKIREQQKENTLNWIERRITSSLMRINSPGINPNQLYWQEKDLKIATDNIKLHSELKGEPIELFCQFFHFAIEKIKSLTPELKLPNYEKLKNIVENITEQLLLKRIGHIPSNNDIKNMVDGERYEIARQLAIKIGKFLDKALYTKFKKKRRNG